jgi:hypothetical protein
MKRGATTSAVILVQPIARVDGDRDRLLGTHIEARSQ